MVNDFRLFKLLEPAQEIATDDIVELEPHETVGGAYHLIYLITEGQIVLTYWRDKLHEVIYQTPYEDEAASAERNSVLFAHYGDGHQFNEILDNGFGKTYRRADMQRYALWSYAMDYVTFGTMEFHAVKWK